jgi:hypothetical protein
MIAFSCPTCGKKISVPESAGSKHAKCPKCHAYIAVPQDETSEDADDAAASMPTWLIPAAKVLVAVAVAAAVGVVFGNHHGHSAAERELTETQSRLRAMSDNLKALEVRFQAAQTERDSMKQQIASLMSERDALLAARSREDAARQRREAEEKAVARPQTEAAAIGTGESEIGADGRHYQYDPTTNTYYYRDASGKTVHVNGYTRKDGTQVRSYNRAPPGAAKSPTRSGGGRK